MVLVDPADTQPHRPVDSAEVQEHVSGAAQLLRCVWQCDARPGPLPSPPDMLSRLPSSQRTPETSARSRSSQQNGQDDAAAAHKTYLRDWSRAPR